MLPLSAGDTFTIRFYIKLRNSSLVLKKPPSFFGGGRGALRPASNPSFGSNGRLRRIRLLEADDLLLQGQLLLLQPGQLKAVKARLVLCGFDRIAENLALLLQLHQMICKRQRFLPYSPSTRTVATMVPTLALTVKDFIHQTISFFVLCARNIR